MSDAIENLLHEDRRFAPSEPFRKHANAQPDIYQRAAADHLAFWADEAAKLRWMKPWEKVLDDSNPPFYRWFTGGQLNPTVSCLDRHLAGLQPDAQPHRPVVLRADPPDPPHARGPDRQRHHRRHRRQILRRRAQQHL